MAKTELSRHDQILTTLAAYLKANGYEDIHVDHLGDPWPCPLVFRWDTQKEGEGHRPDVYATKGGERLLVEVEEEHTFATQHTKDQLKLFAANVEEYGGECVLLVPKNCEAAAKTFLAESELGNVIVWTVSDKAPA